MKLRPFPLLVELLPLGLCEIIDRLCPVDGGYLSRSIGFAPAFAYGFQTGSYIRL